MLSVTSVEAQSRFGELIDRSQREPIAVTRRGRTVAYVVSSNGGKRPPFGTRNTVRKHCRRTWPRPPPS